MPLITTSHDSLPSNRPLDIDPEPTPLERSAAEALIAAELPLPSPPRTHPSLPPLVLPTPTPAMASEYARIEASIPISGIDLSRYEELSVPQNPSLQTWQQTLAQAHTSATYLSLRNHTLTALEASGKETWLSSNEHLVSLLSSLEKELADTKEAVDRTVLERQGAQEAVKGETVLLERNWREGVGRVLETEVAAEGLRGGILEARRARGGG